MVVQIAQAVPVQLPAVPTQVVLQLLAVLHLRRRPLSGIPLKTWTVSDGAGAVRGH